MLTFFEEDLTVGWDHVVSPDCWNVVYMDDISITKLVYARDG